MLKEASSLRLDKLSNHVAQNRTDGVEALIGGADVVETIVIKQNLLHNEDGNSLAKLGASLHDSQAERNNLGREEEVDDLRRVVLYERSNDTKTRQSEILKWSRLGRRIEERVEKKRDMRWLRVSERLAIAILQLNIPLRNRARVSLCEATHCRSASALHTRLEAAAVSCEGLSSVYTEMISCRSEVMTPKEVEC